jgi:hypothetical protein
MNSAIPRVANDDIALTTLPKSMRFREGIDLALDGSSSLKVVLEPTVSS